MKRADIERPEGFTDEQWTTWQWDCAMLSVEHGSRALLVKLILREPIPKAFRKQVASLIAAIPKRDDRPAVRPRDVLAILREANVLRDSTRRPNFKALKSTWAATCDVKASTIGDVIATRKTYARFAKYRPSLYAKSKVTVSVTGSASGAVTQRRGRSAQSIVTLR